MFEGDQTRQCSGIDHQIDTLLVLIPALAAGGVVAAGGVRPRVLGQRSHLPVVLAFAGSFVLQPDAVVRSAAAKSKPARRQPSRQRSATSTSTRSGPGPTSNDAYTPPQAGGLHADGRSARRRCRALTFTIDITLRADPLTSIMLCMVTFISYAGGDLRQRLHARRSRLLAVLHLHRAVRVFDDDAGLGQQLRAAVRVLGSGRPVQLSADRLLVRKARRPRRPARRRFWSTASATSALPSACF